MRDWTGNIPAMIGQSDYQNSHHDIIDAARSGDVNVKPSPISLDFMVWLVGQPIYKCNSDDTAEPEPFRIRLAYQSQWSCLRPAWLGRRQILREVAGAGINGKIAAVSSTDTLMKEQCPKCGTLNCRQSDTFVLVCEMCGSLY